MSMRTTNARVVAVLAASAALTCSVATTASAAAGATGHFDVAAAYVSTYNQTALRAGGWAFNRHTVPVQEVRVLSYNGSGGVFNTTYLTANKSRPDVVRAGAATTQYVGFDSTFNLSQVPQNVCVDTHDKGEAGGWVRLGCKVPSVTRIG